MRYGYRHHTNVNEATNRQLISGMLHIPTNWIITPAIYGRSAVPQLPSEVATPIPLTCILFGSSCKATTLPMGKRGPMKNPDKNIISIKQRKYARDSVG